MVTNSNLLKLFEEYEKDRRDFSNREWETIKFTTTVFGVFLTATITIIIYLYPTHDILWMFVVLPIFMLAVTFVGYIDYKREYSRLFERVATLIKIEEKVGFHDERDTNRKVLLKDNFYLSDDFIDIGKKYDTTKDFIKGVIKDESKKRGGNSLRNMRIMFSLYALISIILILVLITLNIIN